MKETTKNNFTQSKRDKTSYIKTENISEHQSGTIAGRLEAIDSETLYLNCEKEKLFFYHNIDPKQFLPGDFIKLLFTKNNNNYQASEIILLSRPKQSPVSNPSSSYHKLHRQNKALVQRLYRRQIFFQEIRNFFVKRNFLELHTPTLVESPGIENHIEPFITTYIDYDNSKKTYYLPTSPEFSLKEALGAGLEQIFEIAKVFRNKGENSNLHNPGFFMLEWYRAYTEYRTIMEDCRDLLLHISNTLYNKDVITYQDSSCDITNIQYITVKELFAKHSINLDTYTTDEEQFKKQCAQALNLTMDYLRKENLTKEDIYFRFFLEKIEPTLGFENPVIVYQYPADMAALSKIDPDNPLYARRFELYICGIELANAYEELIDPVEQKQRFEETIRFRNTMGKIPLAMPERFQLALNNGLPPCSGIALGIERLFMVFENLTTIQETNLVNFRSSNI